MINPQNPHSEKPSTYQKHLERNKKWCLKHPDYHKEYCKQYYLTHKEQAKIRYKKYRDNFYQENKERIKQRVKKYQMIWYPKRKEEVFKHYSSELKCAKCGFSDIRALSVDHINGGGTKHRREIGKGAQFYNWLKKNNYPEGFQILCMNCQFIKRVENHEERGRKYDAH